MRDITAEPVHQVPKSGGSLRTIIVTAIGLIGTVGSVQLSPDAPVAFLIAGIVVLACAFGWWVLRYNDKQDARVTGLSGELIRAREDHKHCREDVRKRDVLIALCYQEHHTGRRKPSAALARAFKQILGEDEARQATEGAKQFLAQ